jgi:hypothetical protein
MSINVHVLFIGIILLTGLVMTGSLNMNAYAKTINGNNDDNTLKGTPNDDRLKGKNGDDVFHGYSGADYFDCGKGKDTIKDFNPSEGGKKSSGCEKVDYEGKNHDDDGKSDNNDGRNSADQGISQGQSSDQSAQCVSGVDIENSCNNISAQNQANTGNSALGQQGGSGGNYGDGGNSADQGISQGQSIKQRSQCVSGEDAIVSCDNVAFQNLVNSGKNVLGQTP